MFFADNNVCHELTFYTFFYFTAIYGIIAIAGSVVLLIVIVGVWCKCTRTGRRNIEPEVCMRYIFINIPSFIKLIVFFITPDLAAWLFFVQSRINTISANETFTVIRKVDSQWCVYDFGYELC